MTWLRGARMWPQARQQAAISGPIPSGIVCGLRDRVNLHHYISVLYCTSLVIERPWTATNPDGPGSCDTEWM